MDLKADMRIVTSRNDLGGQQNLYSIETIKLEMEEYTRLSEARFVLEISERAAKYFEAGFNCAESVLMSLAEPMAVRSDLIPKIATPFGGGIGRSGSVCGALIGGVMAIGLKVGRSELKDTKRREKSYEKALELFKRFEKEFGSPLCYDLVKLDLTTPEGKEKIKTVRLEKCINFVRAAARNVAQLTK